ncbi:MAG: 5,10-methylene tetrahydromethanopterin reductase [Rhizobacter sp.]|nr:5,10-methylene tetrahydromethanopterin reductase [Rhizobacter sp.]
MKAALSILDLVPVTSGGSAAEAIRRSVELATLGERLGYVRLWFAEHHGMPAVASASPEVLIAHIAAVTRRMHVGSGGIMLPNHAPLRIAEAFRTLAALHPGRIDLGIGRAPGSDANASRALRAFDGDAFPGLLSELLALCGQRDLPREHVLYGLRAVPDDAPLPPIWMLGSSGASARLAGNAGMGYSFASHFSSTPPKPAFDAYRAAFQPSAQFEKPHAILGVSVVCADNEADAEAQASAMDLAKVRLRSGLFTQLPTPEEASGHVYSDAELRLVRENRRLMMVGTPDSVRAQIQAKAEACGADEVMIVSGMPDHALRLRSYELIAEAFAGAIAEAVDR